MLRRYNLLPKKKKDAVTCLETFRKISPGEIPKDRECASKEELIELLDESTVDDENVDRSEIQNLSTINDNSQYTAVSASPKSSSATLSSAEISQPSLDNEKSYENVDLKPDRRISTNSSKGEQRSSGTRVVSSGSDSGLSDQAWDFPDDDTLNYSGVSVPDADIVDLDLQDSKHTPDSPQHDVPADVTDGQNVQLPNGEHDLYSNVYHTHDHNLNDNVIKSATIKTRDELDIDNKHLHDKKSNKTDNINNVELPTIMDNNHKIDPKMETDTFVKSEISNKDLQRYVLMNGKGKIIGIDVSDESIEEAFCRQNNNEPREAFEKKTPAYIDHMECKVDENTDQIDRSNLDNATDDINDVNANMNDNTTHTEMDEAGYVKMTFPGRKSLENSPKSTDVTTGEESNYISEMSMSVEDVFQEANDSLDRNTENKLSDAGTTTEDSSDVSEEEIIEIFDNRLHTESFSTYDVPHNLKNRSDSPEYAVPIKQVGKKPINPIPSTPNGIHQRSMDAFTPIVPPKTKFENEIKNEIKHPVFETSTPKSTKIDSKQTKTDTNHTNIKLDTKSDINNESPNTINNRTESQFPVDAEVTVQTNPPPTSVDISAATSTTNQPTLETTPPPPDHEVVIAIDFGTTFSGYAFAFTAHPEDIYMMRRWDDRGVFNHKAPTTVLLDENQEFHSFGFAARDHYHNLAAEDAKYWFYFEKFKMSLHYEELRADTKLTAANGQSLLAITVFSHALSFLKGHALQQLSDSIGVHNYGGVVRWVISVPAIWKSPAKQFMRLAAYKASIADEDHPHHLLISLEPEAASIYCRSLRKFQLAQNHHNDSHTFQSPTRPTVAIDNLDPACVVKSDVKTSIAKYNNRGVTLRAGGMLRLDASIMTQLFRTSLNGILTTIGAILNDKQARDLSYMFLVGGFAESAILQHTMKREFGHILRVIIPQDVTLAVLKGAVMFGLDPTTINLRRSRLSYGVGILKRFQPNHHPSNKRVPIDHEDWCNDAYEEFVSIDQPITLGETIRRSYVPVRSAQSIIKIKFYSTVKAGVEFITDESIKECGVLALDLSEGSFLEVRDRRQIEARMMFGDTEIKVSALDLCSGVCVKARIDFLNNW